jgi:hypothetical protein
MELATHSVRGLIPENQAKLVELAWAVPLSRDVFTRYWPSLQRHDLDACAEYLAAFASSPNAAQVRTWLNQANIELASNK